MTREKLIELIEHGSDIMLDIAGGHYVIFTWLDDGIGIGEQNSTEPLTVFKTPEALINGFSVKGRLISEQLDRITVTDYS